MQKRFIFVETKPKAMKSKNNGPQKFKAVKTLKQAKNDPRVCDLYEENDQGELSWWLHLKPGYLSRNMGCHTIHEKTLGEVINLLNNDVYFDQKDYNENK